MRWFDLGEFPFGMIALLWYIPFPSFIRWSFLILGGVGLVFQIICLVFKLRY